MARYLDDLEALLADPDGPVRIDDAGELHLRPLAAEVIDPAVLSVTASSRACRSCR
jgi:hypothetical protein